MYYTATPQLTFINISILVLHIISIGKTLFVHKISAFSFNVRVNDGNKFAPSTRQIVNHVFGMGKLDGIPREVLLSICVLNVQPHDVNRHIVGIKVFDDGSDVVFIVVVPSALVIRQRKVLKIDIYSLKNPKKVIQ